MTQKVTDKDSKYRFDNMDKDKLKDIQEKSNVACNTAEVKEKMSISATKRHFRENNPAIAALMEAYDSRDQMVVMDKYVNDNEKFVVLYNEAKTTESKAKIWGQYQGFQLKIFELMFGSKSFNLNANISADWKQDVDKILTDVITICPKCGAKLYEDSE